MFSVFIKGFDIHIDFSDLKGFFDVEGEVKVSKLRPGMELEKSVIIKPKYSKGTFPITIKITRSGATIEKEYTIKVGGTEIY